MDMLRILPELFSCDCLSKADDGIELSKSSLVRLVPERRSLISDARDARGTNISCTPLCTDDGSMVCRSRTDFLSRSKCC